MERTECLRRIIMTMVAIFLILLFAAYIFSNYWWWLWKAKWQGIETNAYISRIEENKRTSDGAEFPRRFFYVRFFRQDGLQTEARLLNPKGVLMIGDEIRIRYLEEKNDFAVQIG